VGGPSTTCFQGCPPSSIGQGFGRRLRAGLPSPVPVRCPLPARRFQAATGEDEPLRSFKGLAAGRTAQSEKSVSPVCDLRAVRYQPAETPTARRHESGKARPSRQAAPNGGQPARARRPGTADRDRPELAGPLEISPNELLDGMVWQVQHSNPRRGAYYVEDQRVA
jgi:hypothetical protein